MTFNELINIYAALFSDHNDSHTASLTPGLPRLVHGETKHWLTANSGLHRHVSPLFLACVASGGFQRAPKPTVYLQRWATSDWLTLSQLTQAVPGSSDDCYSDARMCFSPYQYVKHVFRWKLMHGGWSLHFNNIIVLISDITTSSVYSLKETNILLYCTVSTNLR